MNSGRHEQFMSECLRLAELGKGSVSPNPMVGAVLVKKGRIVARGVHRRFGGSHAEVECIRSYRGTFRGTTLYVNLEPCSHHGKTPPCADLIVRSRIPAVVVAMRDPNPLVSGKGIRKLRKAGIKVLTGVLEQQARELNRIFVTHMTKRRPFVHVKVAQTLDGKIALRPNTQTWITGTESRNLVHRWRAEHDVVLVGANTIRVDDPMLSVRFARGRDPGVAVLDGNLSINPRSRVFRSGRKRRVLILTSAEIARRRQRKVGELTSRGATVLPLPSKDSCLPLRAVLRKLYSVGIGSVLVEGGSNVYTQFLKSGSIDLLSLFFAPSFFAGGVPAIDAGSEGVPIRLSGERVSCRFVGKDILLQFRFT